MDDKCTELSVLSSALQQNEAQRAHGREELRRERERADKCEEALRDVREELVKKEEEANKLRRACEGEVATLRDKEEELLQHRAAAAVNHRLRKEVESELAVCQQELQATLALHAAATLALEAEEEALHTGVETLLSAMGALQEAVVSQVCERQRETQAASTVLPFCGRIANHFFPSPCPVPLPWSMQYHHNHLHYQTSAAICCTK